MTEDDQGSVTRWLYRLRAGDAEAAQPLWERYFQRLVDLARRSLRAARQSRADEDEEDAALSAFDTFCAGARAGRFPRLDDRDDLWRLLVCLTTRKAIDQRRRRSARIRGGGRVALETDLRSTSDDGRIVDQIVGAEPSAAFAAQLAEDYRRRMESLRDPTLQRIARMKFESHTNEEISTTLGCSLRTVTLKLELIRKRWTDEPPP